MIDGIILELAISVTKNIIYPFLAEFSLDSIITSQRVTTCTPTPGSRFGAFGSRELCLRLQLIEIIRGESAPLSR